MPGTILNQPGPSYAASSTTSQAIGTGSQTFTVQSGLAYQQGAYVSILSTGSGSTEYGRVTSYSGTSLIVNSISTTGGGTHTDWIINLSSPPPAPGAWTAVTFTNSWANVSGFNATRYRLEACLVVVRLSGAIKSGSTGTSAFTLPSGYQPANTVTLPVYDFSNNVLAYVTIATAGTVTVTCASTPQISLEGLTFPTN